MHTKKSPASALAPAPNKFLNVPAVAALLGVSPQLVYKLVREGKLPYTRIGRCVRIRQRDLDALGEDTKCK